MKIRHYIAIALSMLILKVARRLTPEQRAKLAADLTAKYAKRQ